MKRNTAANAFLLRLESLGATGVVDMIRSQYIEEHPFDGIYISEAPRWLARAWGENLMQVY